MKDLETQDIEVIDNDELSMDDTIAKTWADIQARGAEEEPEKPAEMAKPAATAKPAVTEIADTATADSSPQTPAQPVAVDKKAPSSWNKETQEAFTSWPAAVQDQLLKREDDFHKGIQVYKQAAAQADVFNQTLAPFIKNIQDSGVETHQAMQSLFQTESTLRNGNEQQKLAIAAKILQDYRIDPQKLLDALQSGTIQQADPAYMEMRNELNLMKSQQTEQAEYRKQQEDAQALNSLTEFSKGKEHYESVRNSMADLLDKGIVFSLEEAYTKAVRLDDSVWAKEQAKQQATTFAESQKKVLEARKAAAVNVTKRGVFQPKPAASTWDQTISAEAARLGLM